MIDITHASTWIPIVGGIAIPFVVALLTKITATPFEKSVIAIASAALLALGTYLADVNQSHTWRGALTAFALALIAAASSRVTVTGGADTALAAKTENFGVGSSTRRP